MGKLEMEHYYKITHKDNNGCIKHCIIKVIKDVGMCSDHIVYNVLILRSEPSYSIKNIRLNWYEDWCIDIKEIVDKSELLAIVL